jgi:AbrB family looped-hinge helix DNA binding protein
MRITSKGQVTIPQEIREELGLLPHTDVDFVVEENGVRIVKAAPGLKPSRGALLIARMKRAKGHVTMSTDEIMALTRSEK